MISQSFAGRPRIVIWRCDDVCVCVCVYARFNNTLRYRLLGSKDLFALNARFWLACAHWTAMASVVLFGLKLKNLRLDQHQDRLGKNIDTEWISDDNNNINKTENSLTKSITVWWCVAVA